MSSSNVLVHMHIAWTLDINLPKGEDREPPWRMARLGAGAALLYAAARLARELSGPGEGHKTRQEIK